MVLGLFLKLIGIKTGIPYTLIITLMGGVIGFFVDKFGKVGCGIVSWSNMGAHDILLVFLPALIFESAFNADLHIMRT